MKKVVTIGGGKGQSSLLSALKKYELDLTAIVSVMDSGGSSGRLREEYEVIAPGDLRRCLAALAEGGELSDEWNTRDSEGHAVGNLEIVKAIEKSGSVEVALHDLTAKYNLLGRVLAVTSELTDLVAEMSDGKTVVRGEDKIDVPEHDAGLHIENLRLEPMVRAGDAVTEVLEAADLIVLSMGDLHTSLIPNLLVEGVTEAIGKSSAQVVYVCNRSTKRGETHDFSTLDYYEEVSKYLKPAKLDYFIFDDDTVPVPVGFQSVVNKALPASVELVTADLCCGVTPEKVSSDKVAKIIFEICESL